MFYSLLKNKEVILELQKPSDRPWKKFIYRIDENKVIMGCYDAKDSKCYESTTSLNAIKTISKNMKMEKSKQDINNSLRDSVNSYPVASKPKKKIVPRDEPITLEEVGL